MSGDFDDIVPVDGLYGSTAPAPSLDVALTATRLAWPSDAAIAGFIRAANRWSQDTPVPASLIAEWRSRIVRIAYQRWWAKQKPGRRMVRIPSSPRRHRRAITAILEILEDPWVRVGLAVLSAAAAYQLWVAREAWRSLTTPRFRLEPRHLLSPLLSYAHAKLSPDVPALRESWDAAELSPWHTAAINAVSPAAALALYERLNACAQLSGFRAADALIDELDRLGRACVLEHGKWLSERDPAPPRGLVPYLPAEIVLAARRPAPTDEPPPPGSKKDRYH